MSKGDVLLEDNGIPYVKSNQTLQTDASKLTFDDASNLLKVTGNFQVFSGQIQPWAADVSITKPYYSFYGDLDTGIYSDVLNHIMGTAGGVKVFDISETNTVFYNNITAGNICYSDGTNCSNDDIYATQNETVARIGNCPAGQVVQNTTTSGVQCISPSTTASGDGTGGWTNTTSNTTTPLTVCIQGDCMNSFSQSHINTGRVEKWAVPIGTGSTWSVVGMPSITNTGSTSQDFSREGGYMMKFTTANPSSSVGAAVSTNDAQTIIEPSYTTTVRLATSETTGLRFWFVITGNGGISITNGTSAGYNFAGIRFQNNASGISPSDSSFQCCIGNGQESGSSCVATGVPYANNTIYRMRISIYNSTTVNNIRCDIWNGTLTTTYNTNSNSINPSGNVFPIISMQQLNAVTKTISIKYIQGVNGRTW